jgi:hypothetical protein
MITSTITRFPAAPFHKFAMFGEQNPDQFPTWSKQCFKVIEAADRPDLIDEYQRNVQSSLEYYWALDLLKQALRHFSYAEKLELMEMVKQSKLC